VIAVFLDSNVLVSSLIGSAESPPVQLVDWLAGSSNRALMTGRCCIQEKDPCRQILLEHPECRRMLKHRRPAVGVLRGVEQPAAQLVDLVPRGRQQARLGDQLP
jgi:hypothetical protein